MNLNKKSKTIVFVAIFTLIILSLTTVCLFRFSTPAQGKTEGVETVAAEIRPITEVTKISGVVSAGQSVAVAGKVAGTVNMIVPKGAVVKEGDILMQLDDTDVQLQVGQTKGGTGKDVVAQLELAYNLAEDTYQKNKTLAESGAIPQMQMEQLRVQRDTAKIQYDTAANMLATQLSRTIVRSPIDGIVATNNIQAGETASAGMQVLSIVSLDPVLLKGNLPENMVDLIKVGQLVEVKVDALPGQIFTGKVTFVSPLSVPTGQFFPVEISIANPQTLLKAGMTASAYLKCESTQKLPVVPKTAVLERDGQKYVFIVANGIARRAPVVTGLQDESFVEVAEGLKTGEQVVSGGVESLQDGDTVKANAQ